MSFRPTLKTVRCAKCGDTFTCPGAYANRIRYSDCCTEEERFWMKVNKTDGCWLWTGFLNHDGYGRIGPRKGVRTGGRAHRVVWQFTHGEIPKGMEVMHLCDVRACVRPDHLRLGTHQENIADCISKRRHTFGEKARAKLTEAQVREIRAAYRAETPRKTNAKELAGKYGVTTGTICGIAAGRIWSLLP